MGQRIEISAFMPENFEHVRVEIQRMSDGQKRVYMVSRVRWDRLIPELAQDDALVFLTEQPNE